MLFLILFPFLVITSHSQILVTDLSNDTSEVPAVSEHEDSPEVATVSDHQDPEIDFKSYRSRVDRVWYMYCNKPTIDEEMLKEFSSCYGPQLPVSQPDKFNHSQIMIIRLDSVLFHWNHQQYGPHFLLTFISHFFTSNRSLNGWKNVKTMYLVKDGVWWPNERSCVYMVMKQWKW